MFNLLQFIYQIRRFDVTARCSTPLQLAALQQRRLRALLRQAYAHSPFYRQRLAHLDLERCSLADLPIVKKREFIQHFQGIVTNPAIQQDDVRDFMSDPANIGKKYLGRYVVCHTSGSQGESALLVQEQADVDKTFAMQIARGHSMPKTWGTLWKKMTSGKTRMSVFLFRKSFFPSGAAFENVPPSMHRIVHLQRLNLNDDLAENIEKLNEFQPNIITAYTHVLENLARAELQGQLKLRQAGCLQHVTNISEPLSDLARNSIERAWGVPIANHYAMGECMGLTLGCASGHGAHVNVDMAILENVDRNYRPVPAGTRGEKVLVTNLLNYTQPLIRYEIDDTITLSEKGCPCGSPLPLVQEITGRSNDRLWYRRGEHYQELAMFLFKKIAAGSPDVAEFQVIQTERNRFVLRVEPHPDSYFQLNDLIHVAARELAYEQLAGIITVDIDVADKIEADPRTGKLRRVISQVGIPDDLDQPRSKRKSQEALPLSA